MNFYSLFSLSLGLSADAFTAAICKGTGIRRFRMKYALTVAAFFGAFQGIMPIIGWLFGASLKQYTHGADRWISFALLTIVGMKMIRDSFSPDTEIALSEKTDYGELLMLAVATAIDALAVGVSFALLNVNIIAAATLIGAVTFTLSFAGVYAGFRFGDIFDSRISAAGGLLLIILGIKMLLQS